MWNADVSLSLLGHAQATQILNGLRDEIAMQRVDHEIKFQWDLEMYTVRNPPSTGTLLSLLFPSPLLTSIKYAQKRKS